MKIKEVRKRIWLPILLAFLGLGLLSMGLSWVEFSGNLFNQYDRLLAPDYSLIEPAFPHDTGGYAINLEGNNLKGTPWEAPVIINVQMIKEYSGYLYIKAKRRPFDYGVRYDPQSRWFRLIHGDDKRTDVPSTYDDFSPYEYFKVRIHSDDKQIDAISAEEFDDIKSARRALLLYNYIFPSVG